jgi:Arc/MetJ-type ribon-helix-helix transcriptional regulator
MYGHTGITKEVRMAVAKIAIALDQDVLSEVDRLVRRHVFPNRSRAIREAVGEKIRRLADDRLARECAKLDRVEINSVNLPKPTWAKVSQIRTLSVEHLGRRMGRVSDEEMSQIVDGLNEIIGEQRAAGYRR